MDGYNGRGDGDGVDSGGGDDISKLSIFSLRFLISYHTPSGNKPILHIDKRTESKINAGVSSRDRERDSCNNLQL